MSHSEVFLPVDQTATRLGVPAAWLKAEAKADRLPHLKAGRRILFHVQTVERALLARASDGNEVPIQPN